MIRAVVIGDDRLKAWLSTRYPEIVGRLEKSMARIVISLTRKIKEEKLSGQVLKNQTGRLRRSITPNVFTSGTAIIGEVSTNVEYAAIHEYGGKTPPHVILPKHGRALAFSMGGKDVVVAKVNHPGSVIPERSFMRTALREMETEINLQFKEVISEVIKP